MIILGIDPGSRKSGYAFIEVSGPRKLRYLASGVLYYDHIEDFLERPGEIYKLNLELLTKFRPDEIALEALIYVKSPTALMKLAQTRGAMLAAFVQTHKGKVFEYAPNLVKSTTTGHGLATKESVQKFLTMILGPVKYKTNDESDALAVAICHALHRRNV